MNATTETGNSDTNDTDTDHPTTTVSVAIRVPRGADATLVTAAERRLERADRVVDAAIEEIHAIKPGLSATDITAPATIEMAGSLPVSALRAHFADTLGVEVLESGDRQEADPT